MPSLNPPIETLRTQWTNLYAHQLPSLAASHSPVQPHWPVHLDHCFARIILDNAIGIGVPWTAKVEAPAVKNMSGEQLKQCIKLGVGIAEGKEDLVELDRRSLDVRGKVGKGKKRALEGGDHEGVRKVVEAEELKQKGDEKENWEKVDRRAKKAKPAKEDLGQADIRALMSGSTTGKTAGAVPAELAHQRPSGSLTSEADDSPPLIDHAGDMKQLIATSADLTAYRKKVLLLLTQVPPGRYTTYAALSSFLHSSPRAVGNAMRNNPFAPTVPCHRVLAANGGIGGFGGDWGAEGKHAKEKTRLLREEGVKFDGKGKVVGQPFSKFV
ncbi:MAG: methylated-DNA--protein-cysteine methyltransferase [Pleopsidium flavum]|nr:MAG: methylated-DNA--protein-cysteine methyltransferase [Pleopsidium flavum]